MLYNSHLLEENDSVMIDCSNDRLVLGLKRGDELKAYLAAFKTKETDVYRVQMSAAHRGYGSIVYAFALMHLNLQNSVLRCDESNSVSSSALKVWDRIRKYSSFRKRVTAQSYGVPLFLDDGTCTMADDSLCQNAYNYIPDELFFKHSFYSIDCEDLRNLRSSGLKLFKEKLYK